MSHDSPSSTRALLVDVLGKSVYHALGLKECLEQEREALESGDTQALQTAVETKRGCIERLQRLEDDRAKISAACGFGASPRRMPQLAAWCDEDSVLTNCWQHLIDIATECSTLNMTNGAIIRVRKRQIDTNLLVLRGDAVDTAIYGHNGKEMGGLNHRSLAEA